MCMVVNIGQQYRKVRIRPSKLFWATLAGKDGEKNNQNWAFQTISVGNNWKKCGTTKIGHFGLKRLAI